MSFLVPNTGTIGLDQSGIISRAGAAPISVPNAVLLFPMGEGGTNVGKTVEMFFKLLGTY